MQPKGLDSIMMMRSLVMAFWLRFKYNFAPKEEITNGGTALKTSGDVSFLLLRDQHTSPSLLRSWPDPCRVNPVLYPGHFSEV